MIITYKDFHKLTFPVYKLPSDNWYSVDGLLYVDDKLVDDKNMPGETLGRRRLQTFFRELLPLRKAADNITALIKVSGGPYIDSIGKCFIYQKSKFGEVKYHKIKSVVKQQNFCVLRLYGINFSFTIPRPPKPEIKWAGVFYFKGIPWLLYEYAETKLDSIRRKI